MVFQTDRQTGRQIHKIYNVSELVFKFRATRFSNGFFRYPIISINDHLTAYRPTIYVVVDPIWFSVISRHSYNVTKSAIYSHNHAPIGYTRNKQRSKLAATASFRLIDFLSENAPDRLRRADALFRREIKLIGWRGFQIVGRDNDVL